MAFFNSTAAELTRRCDQNKNDIEEIYKQGKETNTKVDQLATKVDQLSSDVGVLKTDVGVLKTDVSDFRAGVNERFKQVDERFDRLERLLAPARQGESIRLLESKVDLYSNYTRRNTEELERHRQLFAAHEARFDALDGQMAEVLSILRSKPA